MLTVYSALTFFQEQNAAEAGLTFNTFKECVEAVANDSWVPSDKGAIAKMKAAVARETYPAADKLSTFFSSEY